MELFSVSEKDKKYRIESSSIKSDICKKIFLKIFIYVHMFK